PRRGRGRPWRRAPQRRPGDRSFLDDGEAADGLVVHIDVDRAVLGLAQLLGEPMSAGALAVVFGLGALAFWFVGAYAPPAFLGHFTVFVLACFVGYMVVWNVTPSLHTPLMSVTNAISSIIAIGALVQIAPPESGGGRPDDLIRWIAVAGIGLTAINMFGGFAVTRRMLAMFRK
ncbi:MAG: proton-translocating transhydrogenase family protein, partial [Burkholderiales bacterium]|nr:proton-translocating transhydrogenase family protein [Burkholderiales bacterium]